MISVEFEKSTWNLSGVKLGDKKISYNGIVNSGDVAFLPEVGYVVSAYDATMSIKPALVQGKDAYATWMASLGDPTLDVMEQPQVLSPDGSRIKFDVIDSGSTLPIRVGHDVPTEVSVPTEAYKVLPIEVRVTPFWRSDIVTPF